jgi:hypothetical protein
VRADGGQDGILYVNAAVRITQIGDGTSNTLLVGERPPSNDLYFGWMWAGSGKYPFFGTTDVVLGVREVTNGVPNGPRDYFRPGSLNDPQNIHRYHFWSLHPGGGTGSSPTAASASSATRRPRLSSVITTASPT